MPTRRGLRFLIMTWRGFASLRRDRCSAELRLQLQARLKHQALCRKIGQLELRFSDIVDCKASCVSFLFLFKNKKIRIETKDREKRFTAHAVFGKRSIVVLDFTLSPQ